MEYSAIRTFLKILETVKFHYGFRDNFRRPTTASSARRARAPPRADLAEGPRAEEGGPEVRLQEVPRCLQAAAAAAAPLVQVRLAEAARLERVQARPHLR